MSRVPDGQGLSVPLDAVNTIVVCAAVIERDGRYLITRRQKGAHLEGYWEFPGGKCDPGETQSACLARELMEELDVSISAGVELFTTTHEYPDRRVELHFLMCTLNGEPRPQLGQEMVWAERTRLTELRFPPADEELIQLLARP